MHKFNQVKLVTAMSCCFLAPTVFAQDQSGEEMVLEEVMVVAQKRAQSEQDVAISMTVQSGQQLEDIAAFEFQDLQKVAAGVQIGGTSVTDGEIKMRGVGKDAFQGLTEDAVVVFVDGVAQAAVGAVFSSLSDIQQVEVLRGPQGTLYGKNAPAGAINITTRPVNMNETEFDFRTSFGYYNETSTWQTNNAASINVPLVEDKFGFRLSGFYDDSEGSIENMTLGKPANDSNRKGGRLKLQYTPLDDLSFTLTSNYVDNYQGRDIAYQPGFGESYDAYFAQRGYTGEVPRPDRKGYVSYVDLQGYTTSKIKDALLNIEWGFGDYVLRSLSYWQEVEQGYRDDRLATPVRDQELTVLGTEELFSQELQLHGTNNDNFHWLFGLYYADRDPTSASPTNPNSQQFFYDEVINGLALVDQLTENYGGGGTKTKAVFAHSTWDVNDEWSLVTGLRYSDEEKDIVSSLATYLQNCRNLTPYFDMCSLLPPGNVPVFSSLLADNEDSWDNLSGSIKLQYRPTDNTMYYGAFDTAYRAGGFNLGLEESTGLQTFDDEETYAFELGAKTKLANGRVRLNADIFYQVFEGYQFGQQIRGDNPSGIYTLPDGSQVTILGVAGFLPIVLNADKATSQGLEGDFYWVANDWFELSGGLSYVKTEYKDFMGLCSTGETEDTSQLLCDRSGDPIGSQFGYTPPNWSLNLQPQFFGEFGSGMGWFARTPLAYDDVRGTNLDLFVGINPPNGSWDLTLWMKNATNQTPGNARIAYVGAPGSGVRDTPRWNFVAPRQLGITFSYHK